MNKIIFSLMFSFGIISMSYAGKETSTNNHKDTKKEHSERFRRPVKLPNAKSIKQCLCEKFDLEHFVDNTHIDEDLGEKTLDPLILHSRYVYLVDRYRTNLGRSGNPASFTIGMTLLAMRKQVISECLLNESPEAIEDLEIIGAWK